MMKMLKKARLLTTWAFTGIKTTAAIDITSSCNLKCSHCYWWKEERPAELDDDAITHSSREGCTWLRRNGPLQGRCRR